MLFGSNSTISNLALGNFTNDGTIEVDAAAKLLLDTDTLTNKIGAANGTVKVDATGELRSEERRVGKDIVTNLGQLTATVGNSTISNLALGNFTNDGSMKVDATGELDLKSSTIDQGIVTNLGQLTATVGNSTISNRALGNFTNDGTIEVDAAAKLLLDTDTLTNKIGAANGTVKVDATGELDLKSSTIDQGILTNLGHRKSTRLNSSHQIISHA